MQYYEIAPQYITFLELKKLLHNIGGTDVTLKVSQEELNLSFQMFREVLCCLSLYFQRSPYDSVTSRLQQLLQKLMTKPLPSKGRI